MVFYLSQGAREYFDMIDDRSITGKFPVMWDKFYLSLMVGIQYRRIQNYEFSQSELFIEKFIEKYAPFKYLIIASLLSAEVHRNLPEDSQVEDKRELIQNLTEELLDPMSDLGLNNKGLILLNKYAEGGYRIIAEQIPNPSDLSQFLEKYYLEFAND